MYVRGPDANGCTSSTQAAPTYHIAEDNPEPAELRSSAPSKPQRVSEDWLATLHKGSTSPSRVSPGIGAPRAGSGPVDPAHQQGRHGALGATCRRPQHYVVLPGRIAPITDFMAKLLLDSA